MMNEHLQVAVIHYTNPPTITHFFSHSGAIPCTDTMASRLEQRCKHAVT